MNKSKITIGVISLLVVIGAIFFLIISDSNKALAGISDALIFNKANNTTSILVSSTTATRILATSSRQYALIVNDSPYNIYISLNGDVAAKAYEGIRLNANGGSYEINSLNNYTGSIQGIAVGGSASTTVTEY